MQEVRIISRNSKLAMWQAELVKSQLMQCHSNLAVTIVGITTEGDRVLDRPLDEIGGKGLFIKELEYQLLAGTADIAVHSLKDLPANLLDEFTIGAILSRGNPFDALVSNNYQSLDSMPNGSVIGSSSARRVALLQKYYPHLESKLLRGNLQTRINKLDSGEYDGIILAVAGLERLGLESRIKQVLPMNQFIPSIGQGALAIEICANRFDLQELLVPLHDQVSAARVGAEREMGRFLKASCNLPIAGFAEVSGQELILHGLIADSSEGVYLTATARGQLNNYIQLGQECAEQLLAQGAADIVAKFAKY